MKYPEIYPSRQDGSEPFVGMAQSSPTLADYWRWAHSDILGNTERGIIAEYIVSCALGIQNNKRLPWSSCDLLYKDYRIEVKTSAYLQTWGQEKLSKINFDIAEKKLYDHYTNRYDDRKIRHSDLFVFCVFTETDKEKANPLDMSQWYFYIVPTSSINKELGHNKSISENVLKSRLPADKLLFSQIRPATDHLLIELNKYLRECDVFKSYKDISEYIDDICFCLMHSTWHYSEASAMNLIRNRVSYIREAFSDKESADDASAEVGYCAG